MKSYFKYQLLNIFIQLTPFNSYNINICCVGPSIQSISISYLFTHSICHFLLPYSLTSFLIFLRHPTCSNTGVWGSFELFDNALLCCTENTYIIYAEACRNSFFGGALIKKLRLEEVQSIAAVLVNILFFTRVRGAIILTQSLTIPPDRKSIQDR